MNNFEQFMKENFININKKETNIQYIFEIYYKNILIRRESLLKLNYESIDKAIYIKVKTFLSPEKLAITLTNEKRLPELFIKSIINRLKNKVFDRYTLHLMLDYEKYINAILDIFDKACRITKKSKEYLFDTTEVKSNDLDKNRIDGAIAELRVIVISNELKYSEIMNINSNNSMNPDIMGKNEDRIIYVEVTIITSREISNNCEFISKIRNKYNDKMVQLSKHINGENECIVAIGLFDDFWYTPGVIDENLESDIKKLIQNQVKILLFDGYGTYKMYSNA